MEWVRLIREKSVSLGIDPRVFWGIPKLSPNISNTECEARADMYSSRIVYAAIGIKDGIFDGDWILEYIVPLQMQGISYDFKLICDPASDLHQQEDLFKNYAGILTVDSADLWFEYLHDELNKSSN